MKLSQTTDIEIKDNLLSWLHLSTPDQVKSGQRWYKDAQSFTKKMSKRYSVDRYKVAAVVSCLSPNNKWERNKVDAEAMLKAWTSGNGLDSFKVCTYNANKHKAWRVLGDEEQDGTYISAKSPKTHAFAMNVGRLSKHHVTIDKWHIRACLCKPKDGITESQESCTEIQYRRLEAITSEVASWHKMKSYEVQAIIWVTIKEAWGR